MLLHTGNGATVRKAHIVAILDLRTATPACPLPDKAMRSALVLNDQGRTATHFSPICAATLQRRCQAYGLLPQP